MIEDTIEIKYPIEKLWTEEVDRNHRKEEIRQVSIEYILRFGEKEIPSVFLRKVKNGKDKNAIHAGVDNNSLARVDMVANEVLSFDTCFRLFLTLQKTEFQITPQVTPQVNLIGRNHITISGFIKNAVETIWSINYYDEKKINPKQLSNNFILENFITQHAKRWKSGDIVDSYEAFRINDIELDEDDREKFTALLNRLHEYSRISVVNPRKVPYYIYERMAAVVDKDFYPNRRLLRTLHRVDPGSVGHSKLFTCFVLNVQDFKEYIRRLKAVFIRYVEDTVNNYLSAGLSETDIAVVEIVRDYLNRENNTTYQKRYSWNKKPEGCVGLLISPKNNYFSFSGYQDVNNSTLRANIPGAHDRLSGLIKSIENALNQYHFKSEITNNDERFYEKNTSTFYNLQSDLPLNDKTKARYQCAEKKLFSHAYKNFTSKDNIIVIVTFPPCLQRGCQDLINEYKKICKRIRVFCIGDYNTGAIKEC